MLLKTDTGLQVLLCLNFTGMHTHVLFCCCLQRALLASQQGEGFSKSLNLHINPLPAAPYCSPALSPTLYTPKLSPQTSHNPINTDKTVEGSDILLCVQSLLARQPQLTGRRTLLAFADRHPQHMQALGQCVTPIHCWADKYYHPSASKRQPSYNFSSLYQCR